VGDDNFARTARGLGRLRDETRRRANWGASIARLVESSVENRPEMDRPPEQKEPQYGGKAKLKDRAKETPLEQLAQPRHEEATERGDHIAGGSLARH
jgi:hypothetical protein